MRTLTKEVFSGPLIGGPGDGHKASSCEDTYIYFVRKPLGPYVSPEGIGPQDWLVADTHRYRREKLFADGHILTMWVSEELTLFQAVLSLLEDYNPEPPQ